MPTEEDGTEFDDGQSDEEQLFDEESDIILSDVEQDDDSEETGDDEGQSDKTEEDDKFDFKQGYKEIQRVYSESRDEVKESNTQLESLENQLNRFGGIEKVVQTLDYITADQDFKDLAVKKQNSEIVGIDESKLSPQQKEAFNTIRKVVKSELSPIVNEFNARLKELVNTEINPHTSAMKDVNLEHHIDKMSQKYGSGWMNQLDSMNKLKGSLSDQAKIAPTFKDLDRLYKESLEEDGLYDEFIMQQAQQLTKSKKGKTTSRPRSSGGTETSENDKDKPPNSIVEAGRRVLARERR